MGKVLEVKVDKRDYPLLGRVTRDHNLIHTDRAYAESQGFRDVPAQGVFLQAQFERFIQGLELGVNPTKYHFKFKNPVYDGDLLTFRVEDSSEGVVRVNCTNQRKEKVGVANAAFFPIDDFKDSDMISLLPKNYRIGPKRVEGFYASLGQEPEERVPLTLVSSLIPSSLLELSEKDGIPRGKYSGIQMEIFNQPKVGNFDVDLFITREPRKKGDLYVYPFKGEIHQEGSPILQAEVLVFSSEDLMPSK